MKKKVLLASIQIAGIALCGSGWGEALSQTSIANTQEVTVVFKAMVGDRPFDCGSSYALGKPANTVTPTDFRFYVFDVALIDDTGKAVPLSLTQDGKWQYQNVALLDFEDKSGACTNGTTQMRDRVVGTIPKGNYKGLQFTLGVPCS